MFVKPNKKDPWVKVTPTAVEDEGGTHQVVDLPAPGFRICITTAPSDDAEAARAAADAQVRTTLSPKWSRAEPTAEELEARNTRRAARVAARAQRLADLQAATVPEPT